MKAYHSGYNFVTEVDLVLSEDLTFKESRDISSSLQDTIQSLGDVERAYVTSNYEINKPKMVEIQIYWKNTFYQWLEILIVIKEKLTLKKINAECVFCIFGVSYGVYFA